MANFLAGVVDLLKIKLFCVSACWLFLFPSFAVAMFSTNWSILSTARSSRCMDVFERPILS